MMQEADYGIWSPSEGGYRKKCVTCGGLFVGRKNKVYCGLKCKARQNNDIASMKRATIKPHLTSYMLNMQILEDEFKKETEEMVEIPTESIIARGFDPGAPCKELVYRSKKWYVCGDYAYRPNESEGTLQIQKLG